MSADQRVMKAPQKPLIKIWRYMDISKFISMLENGGLFFSRADKLGDPFEGSFSRADNEFDHIFKWGRDIFIGEDKSLKPDYKSLRKSVFINCWHMNEHESAAMWKLYTQTNESICIQSTFRNLKECLDGLDEEVLLDEVSYIDYKHDRIPCNNVLNLFTHKRKSFTHEQELRALIWINKSISPKTDGIWEKVSLELLIDKIFIAPTSPKWFLELLKKVVIRYGLKKQVKRSSLDNAPFY